MQLVRGWMTFIDRMSPADVALYLLLAFASLLVLAMVRWCIALWRYTPIEQPPRAAGLRRTHRRIS